MQVPSGAWISLLRLRSFLGHAGVIRISLASILGRQNETNRASQVRPSVAEAVGVSSATSPEISERREGSWRKCGSNVVNRQKIAAAVHQAMVEAMNVPALDRFQVIAEYPT